MVSSFDYVKLNAMLRDFYNLTHIRMTVYDESYNEITAFPQTPAPICQFIRANPQAEAACHACDIAACHQAKRQRSTCIYRCHAGLTEAITPVLLENSVVAYLFFGHLFAYDDPEQGRAAIRQSCAAYDLDDAQLSRLISEMRPMQETYILSAAHVMEAVASFLCLEHMITLKKQPLQIEIDDYISQHFAEDISVDALCRRFAIGRTALYAFAKQNYGMGIAQHIRQLRVQRAQALLVERPELSIAQIAEACGFSDYNYFIAVFTRTAGMPPRKYRVRHNAG